MIKNDEPVYEDALGYYPKVKNVGHRILSCSPPYVIGVCGSWGAGKTSFLKMLWAYMGGEIEQNDGKIKKISEELHWEWFAETRTAFDDLRKKKDIELIWFNPWQHQFESSPLVALLNEIRQHFSITRKLFNQAGKIADVTTHSLLNSMGEIAKNLKLPLPSAKTVMERGREYEDENFLTALGSQRFRDFFENAISSITKGRGLLVIFIDDLDRCEGEISYRLLESLKLYLNARNCVYVLGIDQQHLENSVAKALSSEKETWRYRPLARDYLSKMFQSVFHLPVPRATHTYIEQMLDFKDEELKKRLAELFGFQDTERKKLIETLNNNLPRNPRKIKSFIASWKLFLDALPALPNQQKLDWRLTLVLQYLAQFEEPLFRKIEQSPAFYSDELVKFCQQGYSPHPLFDGLELPYGTQQSPSESDKSGSLSGGSSAATPTTDSAKKDEPKRLPEPRIFWISGIVKELAKEVGAKMDEKVILLHLLHSGGKLQ
ncbi:MAG: P-loop NTPase fold protein [Acidobacteriota bacterium]